MVVLYPSPALTPSPHILPLPTTGNISFIYVSRYKRKCLQGEEKQQEVLKPTSFYYSSPVLCLTDIVVFSMEELWQSCVQPFFQNHVLSSCVCVPFCSFLQYFKIFFIIVSVTVICDQWSWNYFVIVLGFHKLLPYETTSFSSMCVPTASACSSSSLPLLWPPCSLRHNNMEMRPVGNPTVASKCSSERKGHCLSF